MSCVTHLFIRKLPNLNYFRQLPLFVPTVKFVETSASKEIYKQELEDEAETKRLADLQLEKTRYKSRLRRPEYNILHERPPYKKPARDFHVTLQYQRQLYGLYGKKSGVNPAICFTTKEEQEDIQEYEKVAYSQTIMERRNIALQRLKDEKKQYELREQNFIKMMESMEEWKKKILEKKTVKISQADEAQEERQRLLEEVRRHFGFKIDYKDDRFQFLLEQKEKEQLKQKKLEKRKKKEEMLLAKLAGLESSSSSKNEEKLKSSSEVVNTEEIKN